MCRYMLRMFTRKLVAIAGGVALGQIYYNFMLKQIPFPGNMGRTLSIVISALLGLGNAISIQMRCVSALILPMYCGKPGRGVLKAVLLTYIVAGPISNLCWNAGEVVRVFACTTQLAQNLSEHRRARMRGPLREAALSVGREVDEVKKLFGSYIDILEPLETELVDADEVEICRHENDFIDDLLFHRHRSVATDNKFFTGPSPTVSEIVNFYKKKLTLRCENQVSRAVSLCIVEFSKAYVRCSRTVPRSVEFALCWPLKLTEMCDLVNKLEHVCDSDGLGPPGLEKMYFALQTIRKEFIENTSDIHLQYKIDQQDQLQNIQDAKETSARVQHAFSEKASTIRGVRTAVCAGTALLMLRIATAAAMYHDLYLQDIDFDNVYVTRYFKTLDRRRSRDPRDVYVLLPLKKMERNKYVDVHSLSYRAAQRKLVSQILKVLLEVVTTTTFVMLDRLFYEALDVVRQHAERNAESTPTRDLEIEVEGSGVLAAAYRRLVARLRARAAPAPAAGRARCLPRPRLMPAVYFCSIYGGYLWILLLLFLNPYTARLRRAVCSYFYPRREKQRILHLYNDILKKRLKMNKTLRRKAVQSVRTHYLTGESLLSMRMKFPQLLGWLRILPAARMTCLICDEVEPRTEAKRAKNAWYTCFAAKCPFIYCAECWREAGRRCLACDPSLAEMSDVDSLTDDERPAY